MRRYRYSNDPQNAPLAWANRVRTITAADGGELIEMEDQDGERFIVDPAAEWDRAVDGP